MRPETAAFTAGGPLPDEDAHEDEIARRVRQLEAISRPVTAEEAARLAECFGPDDCYGVAWSLLHLVESGPGPLPVVEPAADANEWHHRLRWRAVNAGLLPED
ncbi:hypothetical protein [Streptomyces sp. NRRL B-24484]|uniref:hypothetical protein n=1 Tax=Streptomyces sp. NRRL B-24484 TaxID=1463833 RepID=UPI0005B8124A|nr:hypothetical protein [Streptomyces sp. NRRL B-24484]